MMNVRYRGQFRRDYKLMMKRGKGIALIDDIIEKLAMPSTLPQKYQDHFLRGDYAGYKECHIEPDWLLIYGYETVENDEEQLLLVRTGTHADLF